MAKENGLRKTFSPAEFQAVRILGTGAHSTLWQVRDPRNSQVRVLKRVVKNDRSDDRFFRQTINEYEIARQIDHPNVRKAYELRRIRKMMRVRELHLLLEYCPGRSAQEQRPRGLVGVCSVFAQAANALHNIHEHGFVHCDMKPDNIIVDEQGNVKIIDLGHACSIGTIKDRVQGSPDYIAPEQLRREPICAKTDIYNFGASLYWALTETYLPSLLPGKGLGHPTNRPHVARPEELNGEVPPLLSRLVMDCVHLRPADRPPSMREIIARLGIILQKELQPLAARL